MYLKSLVIGLCLALSSTAFANFMVNMPDPVIIYAQRVIFSPGRAQPNFTYSAPNTMLAMEIDNSNNTDSLRLSTLNLEIEYVRGANTHLEYKQVILNNDFFEFGNATFDPVLPNLLIPAGKKARLGCDSCVLMIDRLVYGYDVYNKNQIISINFIYSGWFESNGIPLRNATYSVKKNVID